jgi:hypothetical protein
MDFFCSLIVCLNRVVSVFSHKMWNELNDEILERETLFSVLYVIICIYLYKHMYIYKYICKALFCTLLLL